MREQKDARSRVDALTAPTSNRRTPETECMAVAATVCVVWMWETIVTSLALVLKFVG
jgi:hypothetical protein